MKKIGFLLSSLLLVSLLFISCNKEDDPIINQPPPSTNIDFSTVQIEDFIWQGLNFYYLWKDNVPTLADSKFENTEDYYSLLTSEDSPENFFESLLFRNEDKWSWIVDDYVALENDFKGIAETDGIAYKPYLYSDSNDKIFCLVRYILPDTDASDKDVKRGEIFSAIDGEQLTRSNYQELLGRTNSTINFADFNGGNPVLNGKSIEFTKSIYQENHVYISKTFDISGIKIGYIMYNWFSVESEKVLNNVMANMKAEGINELILDLRYNPGGYGITATNLASMLGGQSKNELFYITQYNDEIQEYYEVNAPDVVNHYFRDRIIELDDDGEWIDGESINSLNLSKLYIITTSSTASSSELVINGLAPYIDVVTIGTTTSGKYTGSLTLYDSDNLRKDGDNLNQSHKYAMQPIIQKTVNKNGESVRDGYAPSHEIIEYVNQMSPLGEEDEPLLAKAIEVITGVSAKRPISSKELVELEEFKDTRKSVQQKNTIIVTEPLPFSRKVHQ